MRGHKTWRQLGEHAGYNPNNIRPDAPDIIRTLVAIVIEELL